MRTTDALRIGMALGRIGATLDAWEESKHPRRPDGKFGSGGGSSKASTSKKNDVFKKHGISPADVSEMKSAMSNPFTAQAVWNDLKYRGLSDKQANEVFNALKGNGSMSRETPTKKTQAKAPAKKTKGTTQKAPVKKAPAKKKTDVFKKHGISPSDVSEMKSAMGNPFTAQAVWSDLKHRGLSDKQANEVFNALKE